ncbi:MAG: hypothetical protein WD225_13380 [Ilumatobacteraceae bacterium]
MASVATGDRTATRDVVLACRGQLRDSAQRFGLLDPRVDDVGTVIVGSSEPGYGSVRHFASEASTQVGVWVNVITAEVSAAQVAAEPL